MGRRLRRWRRDHRTAAVRFQTGMLVVLAVATALVTADALQR